MKIVSIVPSLTELLIDLGLEEELIGRTKFCIHPKEKVKPIPKIGGTKNVNISKVAALNPDIIFANKEENTQKDVEELVKIAPVHVTNISNYSEALEAIIEIGTLTNRQEEARKLVDKIISKFTELPTTDKSVCYLIWQEPLMTVGRDTYIHDLLDKCGLQNVFGSDDRYPTATENEIRTKNPDFVFLSSEPFPFKEKHIDAFTEMFPESKVVLVDGEYFSWYGSRMVLAADYFRVLLKELP